MPIQIHLPQNAPSHAAGSRQDVIVDLSNDDSHKLPAIEVVPEEGQKIHVRSLKLHSDAISKRDLRSVNEWLSRRLPVKINRPLRFRYPDAIKVNAMGTPVECTISGQYGKGGIFALGSSGIQSTALLQFETTKPSLETKTEAPPPFARPSFDEMPPSAVSVPAAPEASSHQIDRPPVSSPPVEVAAPAPARTHAPRPARSVSVSVEPAELIVTPNAEAEIRITLRGLETSEPPNVLLEPEETSESSHFSAATEKLNEFLRLRPPRIQDGFSAGSRTQRKDGDEIVWYQDIRIDLTESQQRSLLASGTVKRRLKVEVPGQAPIYHPFWIAQTQEGAAREYPGWISIDYGTSASTVTVFDPHHVKPIVGLPKEQFDRLCRKVLQTLDATRSPDTTTVMDTDLSRPWNDMLEAIGDQICDQGGRNAVEHAFKRGDAKTCYLILGRLETRLADTPEERLRHWGLSWLHELFADVFRVPPLEALNLRPVELQEHQDGTRSREISSELEVSQVSPLRVSLGSSPYRVMQDAGSGPDASMKGFRTLKRYIGQEQSFLVEAEGETNRVSAEELIQGAWRDLRDRTGRHRQRLPEEFSKGEFTRAILTYPTVSPPSVRRQYEKYGRDLFPTMVWTDYDEAVSSAIFYLMRDYDLGGSLQVGLDTFKSRSHPFPQDQPTSWLHHILVFDIGGGTTDLALIELKLEVEDPLALESEEQRGGHGRYYRMTPKLLGSTGHLQLGGQLITLRVFQALKLLLADQLLTQMSAFPEATQARWLEVIRKHPESADLLMIGDVYAKGALSDLALLEGRHGPYILEIANTVLPTRWKGEESGGVPSRDPRKAFATLWEQAESAKITLGTTPKGSSEPVSEYLLSPSVCQALLEACGHAMAEDVVNQLDVALSRSQFEFMAQPVIHEAAMLAKGLVETRLTREATAQGHTPQLDWLILSGKSCNLDLVMRELRSVLSTLPTFTWNRERITFDPEFAKLSTSIGACYAERLRQFAFDRDAAVKFMKKGLDQLEFDIKNLFFFLPCSFTRMVPFGEDPVTEIFQVGTELYQLDSEPVGKARTAWDRMTLQVTVLRKDYDGGTPHQWGTFIAERLREELQITREELRRNLWVQFEVNHRQQFQLYLCRYPEGEALANDGKGFEKPAGGEFPAFHDGPAHFMMAQDHTQTIETAEIFGAEKKPLVSQNEHGDWVLNYRIAVGVVTSVVNTGHEETVFEPGSLLTSVFHSHASPHQGKAGLITATPLETFYQNGSMLIHAQEDGVDDGWHMLGKLSRPKTSEFPQKCYLTLDHGGTLRLHPGAVPYKMASTPKEMWENPGFVYKTTLESSPTETDPQRDPFSGTH